MVVANARESQRRLARAGAKPDGTGTIGDTHQIFEQFADIAIGETKVAMSSLALDREQSRIDELGKMSADRLFGNARNVGELGCRQSLAADQRGKHVCAGMISDQRRDAHDVRAVFHGSMLAEPWTDRNRIFSAASGNPKAAPWPSFASFAIDG